MRRGRYVLVVWLALVLAAGSAAIRAADTSELTPLDLPNSSVQISLPSDWEVTAVDDYSHFDWGDPGAGYIVVFSAEGADESGCELRMYDLSRGGLDEHAEWVEADRGKAGASTQASTVELAVGEGRLVDVEYPDRGFASEYLWQYDPASYLLTCRSADRHPDGWADVVDSLAWQADSRQAQAAGADPADEAEATDAAEGAAVQRLEFPEFEVAVTMPGDLEVDMEPFAYEMALPPDGMQTSPVTTVLTTVSPDGVMCGLEVFENNPLTPEEHAAWVEEVNLAQPGFEGTVTYSAVTLPAGDAVRIDGYDPRDGVWTTMYLLDRGERRYQLYCLDRQQASDDYRSIADTLELLGAAEETPSWVPEDAVSWAVVEDYTTQVPVTQDDALAMVAFCERALWLEHADGTFEERLACQLTDDPVEPPEAQGTPPAETVFFTGGACEWYSDYWYLTDGSEVWAESYGMSVEPDGTVLAVANYGAEALECAPA